MLNLKDGTLWQWDTGRKIIVTLDEGSTIDKIQYYNGTSDLAYTGTTEYDGEGILLSPIPDFLLQSSNNLTIYLMTTDEDGIKTQESITLKVNRRGKPEDYVYTEEEALTYKRMQEEFAMLQKNFGELESDVDEFMEEYGDKALAQIDKWLDEHPEATTTVQDYSLTIDKMVIGTLGYVTPEMFGAVGNGETDDTNAFKEAIEFITNKIISTQTMYNNVILKITSGVYKITETIDLNPYIKVIVDGNVAIDFYGENSLFNYIALDIYNENENVQQDYQSGVMLDGNGLVLRNKSNSSHVDAFTFNMPIETKKTTLARTVFKNVKIKAFTHGLHIYMKNFYMVTFDNFNFQDCEGCVRFDAGNGSLPYNAGERIIFNNCLFNGTLALTVNTTGIEVYFNDCSFDFLYGMLNSLMSGYNNFTFNKCHIEKISNYIVQGKVGPNFTNTIFDSCLFLLENASLFNHSDKMTIKNSTFAFYL